MLTSLFAQYGKWLVLLGVILFAIAVFNAIRSGRNIRAAAYYALRQELLGRTRRWTLIAVVVAMATIVVAALPPRPPTETTAIANAVTPTPPSASIATQPALTATPTAQPTQPPSPTPTPEPSQTPTLAPTPTPLPNLPAVLLTPLSSSAPPAANAQLSFTTLASITDSSNNPVDPGLAFPAGTRTVKLFFRAAGVNNGAMWSVLCYKGDKLADSVVALWKWGARSQSARAFCGLDGSAGKYRIVTYLGSNKQFEVGFELLPPTPTPQPQS